MVLLSLIRAAFFSLYFPDPSEPIGEDGFGVGDYHGRVLEPYCSDIGIVLYLTNTVPLHNLMRWLI